jgi:hypothetical protein
MIRTPATVTLLLCWLSTEHNLIDLAKKAISYKRIEEHKQESINTQSKIADEYEVKTSMGSSLNHKRTNHHSGEEQERGP